MQARIRRPFLVMCIVLLGLLAASAVALAHDGEDHGEPIGEPMAEGAAAFDAVAPDTAADVAADVAAAGATPAEAIPAAACAGGPNIDGLLLDECLEHDFTVNGANKSVTIWYTKVQSTTTRLVNGTPTVLSHWITSDAQAQQVADWFEDAWIRYNSDSSGHHLYDNGCSNNVNVRMEDGVGWSGIAYWASPGNCWIGIDSPMVRGGGGQWTVYHEAQHYLQYSYDDGCYGSWRPNYPDNSEFVEGYADLGADSVDAALDATGYSGNGYDPHTSMYDKSYGNRFVKYFIEQLGTIGVPTDPWHHMDAMYEHYKECDVQDDLYVLDTVVPALSGGALTLDKLFLNFFAANWAKDWADNASQPELIYWDDDTGAYQQPTLTQNINMAGGTQSFAGTTPDDYAARYYQVTPQAGCPYLQMEVDGAAGAFLGINIMAADTTAPTRVLRSAHMGENFVRTFAAFGANDRLVVAVNSFANTYSYAVNFTCVSPTINILEPKQNPGFALVGDPTSPIAFLSRFEVLNGAEAVRGLVESNFTFEAEGDAVTYAPGSFQAVGDEYWAVLVPPVKPAGTTFVDFEACLDTSLCDTETDALLYVDPGNTDIALTFDASGSMNTEDQLGEGTRLTNARRAGKVIADLLRTGDRILVTDFSAFDNPVGCGGGEPYNCALDLRLLMGRQDVAANPAPQIAAAHTAIDTISAREWTPIGPALRDAKNKLLAAPFSLNPKHIFLLSDGQENVRPFYGDIDDELVDSGVIINTIGFGPESPGDLLAQIAADTGGIYRPVATNGGGASLAAAASVSAVSAPEAPAEADDVTAVLAAPVLPAQLGLANVYDYFDTVAQSATRVFHAAHTLVPLAENRVLTAYIDKSVNELRLVVASKQDDGVGCQEGYQRIVEVFTPDMGPNDRWIPISPVGAPPAPASWQIRNSTFDDVLIVPNPQEGTWRFRTRYNYVLCAAGANGELTAVESPDAPGDLESDFIMNLSVQSTIQLEGRLLGLDHGQAAAGDAVTIKGFLVDKTGVYKTAAMAALVEGPAGSHSFLLRDDGLGSDETAGDGIFSAPYSVTPLGGGYSVRIVAVFADPAGSGNNLIREWNGGFWIKGPRPDGQGHENDGDGDGMPDDWERRCKLDPTRNDAREDFDHDGLSNYDEYLNGTLPCKPDTDRGGENDGSEVHAGRNPLDPRDDKVCKLGKINFRPLNRRLLVGWSNWTCYTRMVLYISTDPDVLGDRVDMGQGIGRPPSGDYLLDDLTNDQKYWVRVVGEVDLPDGGGTAVGDISNPVVVTPKADPDMPSGTVLIENGARKVGSKQVTLYLSSTDTPLPGPAQGANGHMTDQFSLLNEVSAGVQMRISNSANMAGATWEPLAPTKTWTLTCEIGQVCRVYAQFRDAAGNQSMIVFDDVVLQASGIYMPLIRR